MYICNGSLKQIYIYIYMYIYIYVYHCWYIYMYIYISLSLDAIPKSFYINIYPMGIFFELFLTHFGIPSSLTIDLISFPEPSRCVAL